MAITELIMEKFPEIQNDGDLEKLAEASVIMAEVLGCMTAGFLSLYPDEFDRLLALIMEKIKVSAQGIVAKAEEIKSHSTGTMQ
jgi:hypothetical protein